MGTQTRRSIVAVVAAFLLLGPVAIQEASAVGPLELYSPKDDPNYAGEATAPVPWETVLALAAEFDGTPIASARQGRAARQSAMPQPRQYADSDIPGASSQVMPGAPEYRPVSGYLAYGYPHWYPGWLHASPRIPWWSLIPFTKHDFRRGHAFFRGHVSFPWHVAHKPVWRAK